MAGLGTEAAWFGKPSIVCGIEIDEITANYIHPEDIPPSLYGKPDKLRGKHYKIY